MGTFFPKRRPAPLRAPVTSISPSAPASVTVYIVAGRYVSIKPLRISSVKPCTMGPHGIRGLGLGSARNDERCDLAQDRQRRQSDGGAGVLQERRGRAA